MKPSEQIRPHGQLRGREVIGARESTQVFGRYGSIRNREDAQPPCQIQDRCQLLGREVPESREAPERREATESREAIQGREAIDPEKLYKASKNLKLLEFAKKCNRRTRFKSIANYLAAKWASPEKVSVAARWSNKEKLPMAEN